LLLTEIILVYADHRLLNNSKFTSRLFIIKFDVWMIMYSKVAIIWRRGYNISQDSITAVMWKGWSKLEKIENKPK
jgi:hypothetical protein